jgi:hypothetical protein
MLLWLLIEPLTLLTVLMPLRMILLAQSLLLRLQRLLRLLH